MFKNLLLFFCLIVGFSATAGPGDTVHVRAHDAVTLATYRSYNAWGTFPTNKEYHRVNLLLKLGCPTSGCSDWDYTVVVWLLRKNGPMDSSVVRIDTISTNPLVLDTIWNYFQPTERLEIAKMITPYGGYMRTGGNGFNNNWTHTLIYDLTDYQMLLQDSVEFEVQYQGWSSGFAITLDFEMVEGAPARRVHKITKPWESLGGSYQNPSNFNNQLFAEKNITLDSATQYAWLRMSPTGHGFVNSANCAEFCIRDYYVKVNGNTIATQSMWRDDCGLNPVYPQGGTWLYNRANWCPGGKGYWYDHLLTPHITTPTFALDFDIQNYTVTVPAGETPPTYNVGNVLFEAAAPTHQNDVELMEIIAPGLADDFKRLNPLCGKVLVKIRNKGAQPLTTALIQFQFNNGTLHSYQWRGNLEFYEEETVEIPMPSFGLWEIQTGLNTFMASASQPNDVPDEYTLNNTAHSTFEPVEVLPRNWFLTVRTNNVGSDTWWKITRLDDNTVVSQGDNLLSNRLYHDTLRLGAGCYEMVIGDRSGDGLSFWANNHGAGMLRLMGHSGTSLFRSLPLDFGTEYRKYFIVSSSIGVAEASTPLEVQLYPNPSKGHVRVEATSLQKTNWTIEIHDLRGQLVHSSHHKATHILEADLTLQIAPGSYLVKIQNDAGDSVVKTLQLVP